MASAHAAIARGEFARAKRILSGVVCAQDSVDVQQALAIVERRLSNLDASLAHCESVLRIDPNHAAAHANLVNLAIALKNAGRLPEAQAVALRATEVAPTWAKSWHALGAVLWSQGHLDAAADAFDRALALAPHDATVLHARAQIESERGALALAFYERALKVTPNDPELVLGAGLAQIEAGDEQAGIQTLQRLTNERPDWVKGHAALAQAQWQAGETEGFARSFESALGSRPADLPLLVGYFAALMRAERYETVLGRLPSARTAIHANELFDRYEAVCASEAGDIARAERAFAKQAASPDRSLQIAHVRHLLRTRRPEAAAAVAERLVRDPGGMEGWSYLSLAWRLTADPRLDWLNGGSHCVRSFDCTEMLPDLRSLAKILRAGHRAKTHPLGQSPRVGTQSDGNLFLRSEPEFARLRACLESCVARFIAQLPPHDPDHPFLRFRESKVGRVDSYSIWLRAGGFHINHVHPNAWISSCLYIDLPGSIGAEAADPAGWLSIGQPPRELGLDLEPVARIRPEQGKLVLFPSMMWHGSVPFRSGERLTVVSDFYCKC